MSTNQPVKTLLLTSAFLVSAAIAEGPLPPKSTPDTRLVTALQGELNRAMTSLGSDTSVPLAKAAKSPKPYFISYAVADATNVSMSAQFGAITGSNESHTATPP